MTDTNVDLREVLLRPVPDQQIALARKQNYRQYPLRPQTEQGQEPLVDVASYGLAGQSYYSRPNPATGDPLPEVSPTVYLRKSLAEKLADINLSLQQSGLVTQLLGGQVELYIEEGLRSRQTQKHLYRDVFPRLISAQNPTMSKAAIEARRDQLIAAPTKEGVTPAPHATGAAVDITLRYMQPDQGYRPRSMVNMGHEDGATGGTASPDFYETAEHTSAKDKDAQRNRRIFYWLMRGALLPEGESGFVCNPTEWWHWSYGDQMWGALTEAPFAFYGDIELPEPSYPL
jgi:zinc D-Ala-D-Ala dipeptidase